VPVVVPVEIVGEPSRFIFRRCEAIERAPETNRRRAHRVRHTEFALGFDGDDPFPGDLFRVGGRVSVYALFSNAVNALVVFLAITGFIVAMSVYALVLTVNAVRGA